MEDEYQDALGLSKIKPSKVWKANGKPVLELVKK